MNLGLIWDLRSPCVFSIWAFSTKYKPQKLSKFLCNFFTFWYTICFAIPRSTGNLIGHCYKPSPYFMQDAKYGSLMNIHKQKSMFTYEASYWTRLATVGKSNRLKQSTSFGFYFLKQDSPSLLWCATIGKHTINQIMFLVQKCKNAP